MIINVFFGYLFENNNHRFIEVDYGVIFNFIT